MKILYFSRGQSPHDLRFVRSLSATQHQIGVLSLEPVKTNLWPPQVEVLEWPERNETGGSSREQRVHDLKSILGEFHADVVHAGPIPQVASLAVEAGATPLLSMSWGSDLLLETMHSPEIAEIARRTLQGSTMLAADCQTVVGKARELGYTGRVCVFPWGVDLQHFSPVGSTSLRTRLGWEEKFLFLSNRTLEPLYGVDGVARAFGRAARKNPNLRLLVYGRGSQEAEIHALLEEAERKGQVYYGGFAGLLDLPDIYRSADVYLSASHSDGSSVSLMEALACGKPVLVSDIPSNQEWVEPGEQGQLFKDGDEEELTEKMLALAVNTDLPQMAIRSRQTAEAKADWQKNFAILLDAYEQLAHAG
jgi:glycosyltransferase involved in cell wall biosynthesis